MTASHLHWWWLLLDALPELLWKMYTWVLHGSGRLWLVPGESVLHFS